MSQSNEKFMTANFHAHTYRCQHAYGTEREYVETAIEMGIKKFGFSDHVFCSFKNGEVSGMRMKLSEVEDYVHTIEQLRQEYKNDIELYIGFETEYMRAFYEEQVKICKDYGIDYLIMGQHFLGTEFDGPYAGTPTEDEKVLSTYVELVLEGMQTGNFTYLAHPDLIHYIGDSKIYDKHMRYMCEEMKKMDIPLELNMLGMATGRHYPNETFWKIVSEVGNKAVVGIDAHDTNIIQNINAYKNCINIAKKYKIEVLNEAKLRKIS